MKSGLALLLSALLAVPASAEIKRTQRKSLLNTDPEVVYIEETNVMPIKLKVIKAAPVFSDRHGKRKLGTLRANQTITLEALTDKVYRVRGKGTRDGIAGWVAPWAFSSDNPDFVQHLKEFYQRQLAVRELIAANAIAVGMTLDEVSQSRGKPTKTTVRKTSAGQTGNWEYIDYEDIKHYITQIDPRTGNSYRVYSHTTRIEKGKTAVEFTNDVVTAIEESENNQGGHVRIVVPPLVWRW
ncbi:MAG: hypothetical protein ACQCXQ_10680 [Verrucomicrobiales bacterium]|nr:hypothetical protein [Verrucomicrobiota bacterium JB025]